jgi:hypothetical protein
MSLRFPVEGLDLWAKEIPDGALLVLEGSGTGVTRHVAARVADAAGANGRPVLWASAFPLRQNGSHARTRRTIKADAWADLAARQPGEDLVVDSASWIALGSAPEDLARGLVALRAELEQQKAIGVLILETGVLGEERDALLRHAADGLLQFRTREDPDGVAQFVRIPKWFHGGSVTPNIYFTFDGQDLLVDTRKRVV